jgi:hypothetical protein
MMKKIYNLFIILALPALFLIFTSGMLSSSGSPGGKTGSPGDGGADCTGCHSDFSTINQEGWISSSLVATGYSPGEEYMIIVAGVDPDVNKWGFEATAEDQSGNKVGTIDSFMAGFTQLCNSDNAITHTALGTTPISDTGMVWVFNWIAPTEPVGDVTFYAAINAANGNGNTGGDQIYLSQFTASPAVGISNNLNPQAIKFYPNPATNLIYVESSQNFQDKKYMEIINLHGQLLSKVELSEMKQTIDISAFDTGIYFVRVGNHTERLVIR